MVGDCIIGPNSCNHCTATFTVAKDRKVLKFPRDRIYEEVWVLQIEKVLQIATQHVLLWICDSHQFVLSVHFVVHVTNASIFTSARRGTYPAGSLCISLHLLQAKKFDEMWWEDDHFSHAQKKCREQHFPIFKPSASCYHVPITRVMLLSPKELLKKYWVYSFWQLSQRSIKILSFHYSSANLRLSFRPAVCAF